MNLSDAWEIALDEVANYKINFNRRKSWLNKRVFEIYTSGRQ
jgi:hypothetical protein